MTFIKDWANKNFKREKQITSEIDELEGKEIREKNTFEKEYYNNAKSFEKDRVSLANQKTRVWKVVTTIFVVISIGQVAALIGLTPLKEKQLMIVRVDNNSGYIDVVKASDYTSNPAKNQDDINTQFMVKNYLKFYESYNWYTIKSNDVVIKKQSSDAVYQKYSRFQTSPNGNMNVLGDNGQIQIKDVYFTKLPDNGDTNKVAQIRYTKRVLDRKGDPDSNFPETQWLTVISYNFKKDKDDDYNPLGLNVVDIGTPQQLK